jgi:hypothetical protein
MVLAGGLAWARAAGPRQVAPVRDASIGENRMALAEDLSRIAAGAPVKNAW